MNSEDIIGYLVKLLEEQEQIKITYEIREAGDDIEQCKN